MTLNMLITQQRCAKLMSFPVTNTTSVFTRAGPVMEIETVLMGVMRARRCARREQLVRGSAVGEVSAYLGDITVMVRATAKMEVMRRIVLIV